MLKQASLNIDKLKLWEKLDYSPHSSEQLACHVSTARFKVLCCGRRWGKTVFGGVELTEALFKPQAHYWIIAPTYRLGEKEFRVVWRNVNDKLGIKPQSVNYNVNQGQMRIKLPWDTVVEVVSSERPESLLGEGLDGAVLAEAARHKRETWEQYIEPALSDKRGWALFTSTPRGYNFLYDLYMLGQSHEIYQSWQLPSWTNAVVFPGGYDDPELQRIHSLVSEKYWKQEYCAEFTTFEGQIYDEFDIEVHVKPILYNPLWRNYLAFDFGFSDPFVCYDIMVDPADNVYVWREYQVAGLTTMDHAEALCTRTQPTGYHYDHGYADPRGPDEINTLMQCGLKGITGLDVGWAVGIEAVKRWLKIQPDGKPKLYIDRSCANLVRQVSTLRMKSHREGFNVKEGQHDYDDHGPDALRYFFGQHFVLGGIGNLASVYTPSRVSDSPFTLDSSITLNTRIAYG